MRCFLLLLILLCFELLHAQPIITLTPSNYNGYGVSYFGAHNGSIDLTVTGGTPPYTYQWSNEATTQDLSGLSQGYYEVYVEDASGEGAEDRVTLEAPEELQVFLSKYEYANEYNVYCYGCFNGSIDVSVIGGLPPYTYLWADGTTTEDRNFLGARDYQVTVTDANGSVVESEHVELRQPDRDDWTMQGNYGTDPAYNYIGSADNKDVVFKSNGQERMRLLANGDIKITGMATGSDGILKIGPGGNIYPLWDNNQIQALDPFPYWKTDGNALNSINPPIVSPYLGTVDQSDLVFKTHNAEHMRITAAGKIGIGTTTPLQKFVVSHTDARGGINIDNGINDNNAHSEIRFTKNGNERWALGSDFDEDGSPDFFIWDNTSSIRRIMINDQGKVGINTVPPTNSSSVYSLYVEGGVVTRDVKVTINSFPDYVFLENYDLLTLSELRSYIEEQGHLPHIPSAEEVKNDQGMEVGDLQTRMLRVIEEQALYILQLKKGQDQLRSELSVLKDRAR